MTLNSMSSLLPFFFLKKTRSEAKKMGRKKEALHWKGAGTAGGPDRMVGWQSSKRVGHVSKWRDYLA